MNATNTYLAVFTGSKTSPRRAQWDALTDAQRRAKEQEGMAAWKSWLAKHQAAVITMGGPLGKTKKASADGVRDSSNQLAAFTVVRADSHEAAAAMFENHPHFTIFPGDSVEIMPILPIPGG
jgi:phosphoketolase